MKSQESNIEQLFEFFSECTSHWNFLRNMEHKDWLRIARQYYAWKGREKGGSTIPKLVHQIWLGAPPPTEVRLLMDRWRDNPYGFEYRLWRDEDISREGLELNALYMKANNPATRSDIARYEILKRYGGVYVDTDVELVKNMEEILCGSSFIAGCHPCPDNGDVEVGNAVVASSENGSIVTEIVKELSLLKEVDETDAMTIIKASGPLMLTRILLRSENDSSVGILPSDYFYPLPGFLKGTHEDASSFVVSSTYTIHHWNCSWMKYLGTKRKRTKALTVVAHIIDRWKQSITGRGTT